MKIVLDTNQMFWGVMHPKTMRIALMLTEHAPSITVDENELEKWAVDQIIESVKKNKISISVQLEELLKSDKNEVTPEVAVKVKKVPSPRKKAISKKLKA
jgi:hypothetical protein